ncbi:MAG: hypothetical protein PHH73_00200 [Candidatus Rickettsiella isopodorum]|nr:hypothetical protein [Candidatus Rickettsiella isopodorum]
MTGFFHRLFSKIKGEKKQSISYIRNQQLDAATHIKFPEFEVKPIKDPPKAEKQKKVFTKLDNKEKQKYIHFLLTVLKRRNKKGYGFSSMNLLNKLRYS